MQRYSFGLWALMVIAVLGAGNHDKPGPGVAMAVLVAAHIIAKAIREK